MRHKRNKMEMKTNNRQLKKEDMNGDKDQTFSTLSLWKRVICNGCNRSYKLYCPNCNVALGIPENIQVPYLKLPLKIDIWFQDKIKKSTAPHAKVLASEDVNIISYPIHKDLKEHVYECDNTLVVYPTPTATTMAKLDIKTLQNIKRLIFIDCPWQKAPVILTDERLKDLQCIKLGNPPPVSNFWRYHSAGAGCVSTIEAIHLMLEEYVQAMNEANISISDDVKNTNLSDLLYFFKLLHSHIEDYYVNDPAMYRPPPMNQDEKSRKVNVRNQKEIGRKRKLENRKRHWENYTAATEEEKLTLRKNDRCFNCSKPGHEAKDCPNPCKYCKQSGHWSGGCSYKKIRAEIEAKKQANAASSHTLA